jgi:peptide/nickel transport system permease protein
MIEGPSIAEVGNVQRRIRGDAVDQASPPNALHHPDALEDPTVPMNKQIALAERSQRTFAESEGTVGAQPAPPLAKPELAAIGSGRGRSAVAIAIHVIRRIFGAFLTVFAVAFLVFVVFRVVADPAETARGTSATPEQVAAFNQRLGLDKPVLEQFVDYLGDVARLDFGDSLWQQRPTLEIVLEVVPRTLLLVGVSLTLAIGAALVAGAAAALRPNSGRDRGIMGVSLVSISIPAFWSGVMLVYLFAVVLGILPTSGYGSWQHLVLPVIALALPHFGRLTSMTRTAVLDELNQPWVRAARGRGIPPRRIMRKYALKNALITIVTMAGYELVFATAGTAILVEVVFAWPGVGQTMLLAIQRGDVFLVQTIAVLVAVFVVAVNLAVDAIHHAIDPRVRTER